MVDREAGALWVSRVLGIDVRGHGGGPKGLAAAMAAWQAARKTALQVLAGLEGAVRQSGHPEMGPAVVLLRAIRANLTAEPDTPKKVGELVRYIATDDIIATAERPNVFGVTVSLRPPLLHALAGLRGSLAAGSVA